MKCVHTDKKKATEDRSYTILYFNINIS
eukprot:SAG11_NODE_42074_length_184_cov_36.651163_2_plen_27_part_01